VLGSDAGAAEPAPGEAREFGVEPGDAGVRLDDGSTGCPVAFGPYRVLGLIGRGGMGLVYHAIHEQTREEVAVKTVRVRKRGMLYRIRREIHALARTRHPGLVRIIETGQSEGLPWYAMELLRGRSLYDLLLEAHLPPLEGIEAVPPRSSGWDTRADFILAFDAPDEEDASSFALAGAVSTATLGVDPAFVETGNDDPPEVDSSTQVLPQPDPRTSTSEAPQGTEPPEPPHDRDWKPPPAEAPSPVEPIPGGPRRDFLVLIARLCETLAHLHGEGIVHRDIKPQNIIIRPDGTPVLLDFGLASYFGAEGRESLEVGGKIEGTPEYMSPEQIRGEYVDARADLYAVGCILYEGLTGRVPYRAGTPGGTLRDHLKKPPLPPRSIRDDLPHALDSLVLRLLAKKAGDRVGYARDVIAVLDSLGCVEKGPVEIRSRDYLYRPGFVGRGPTLALFERQVRRSLARPGRCIFLRGHSGVGKTRFIMEVARQLDQSGLTVATGECVPILVDAGGGNGPSVRATLLHPFRPFLQMVADCCLERGCEEVARLLGPGGGVLATCEPSLADLPGMVENPGDAPLDRDGDQDGEGALHTRLIEALGATLAEFGRTCPVVLFIDDLEWADALTLHFLALFHVGVWDAPNVAIVAAFRSGGDDEVIRNYLPVFRDATFVEIEPLEPASLREIVRDMLGSNDVDDRLVAHLARRSGGNPFFVAEFLRAAVADGLIRRDGSGRWRAGAGAADLALDAASLDEAIGLPNSLQGLVLRRLSALPDDARAFLEVAAVVGREIEVGLFEWIEPMDEARMMAALEALLVAQVLDEGRDGFFRFAHDKLREVAYRQIPPERRRALHRSVALAVEAGLTSRGDRVRLSSTLAHHWYRSIADRLAEPEAVERAMGYLDDSIRQAVNAGLPDEAVELGRASARLLGIELPEAPAEVERALGVEILANDARLGERRPADLAGLPACADPEADRAVALLLTIQPPAFLANQLGLFALMASKNLAMTLDRGLGPRAASVFANVALVRAIALDDLPGAKEYAGLALEVDRRFGGTQAAEVLFLKGWFVDHWAAPLRDALPAFERGARAGYASGDALYSCYNHVGYTTLLAAAGEPLPALIAEADSRIARVGRKVLIARFHCVLERQLARALAGETEGPGSLTDSTFDESRDLAFICRTTNAIQVGFYHVARLKLHYYRGEHDEARFAADEAMTIAGAFARQPAEVDLVFFGALALLAPGWVAPEDLEAARGHLSTLQGWRAGCEPNFGHKALLVEAELARAEGLDHDGLRHVEAARAAAEAGFPHHAALAYDLAARHLARIGDDPTSLRRLAVEGYRAWGAHVLADRIEVGG
jgi:predicted ATPase